MLSFKFRFCILYILLQNIQNAKPKLQNLIKSIQNFCIWMGGDRFKSLDKLSDFV